jgi:hypothetical protein
MGSREAQAPLCELVANGNRYTNLPMNRAFLPVPPAIHNPNLTARIEVEPVSLVRYLRLARSR